MEINYYDYIYSVKNVYYVYTECVEKCLFSSGACIYGSNIGKAFFRRMHAYTVALFRLDGSNTEMTLFRRT